MTKQPKNPLILAIDTSCDETSVAVTDGLTILSNVIASQVDLHRAYGGVYPTVAKQAHKQNIEPAIATALKRAKLSLDKIDAIAVTQGPGLAPALEIGINQAKKLASENNKPLIAVNHVEAHALSVLLKRNSFKTISAEPSIITASSFNLPALAIVVSGGHTNFIYLEKISQYRILGETIDDAAGECLDKVGRMLELGYPAGPVVEQLAEQGNPQQYTFPLPMTTSQDYNLSFSGLKTAAFNQLQKIGGTAQLNAQQTANFCASFQQAVWHHLTYKLKKLLDDLVKQKKLASINQTLPMVQTVWLGGGVAANMALRKSLRQTLKPYQLKLKTPFNKKLCGDNAAMIGGTAYFAWQKKDFVKDITKLDRQPRLNLK